MADKTFLDKVYDLKTADDTRALYDDWAQTYESEVGDHGYATPGRIARALAEHAQSRDAAILDFGCGTGLSGIALAKSGFTTIDGADLSHEMLSHARAKEIYRNLWQIDADGPLPITAGDYAAITAIGVIGSGAAPIAVFDKIIDALPPGGLFALSFNDHTLEDPTFQARITAETDARQAKLLFSGYGDHLPGKNMKSRIYILEKA